MFFPHNGLKVVTEKSTVAEHIGTMQPQFYTTSTESPQVTINKHYERLLLSFVSDDMTDGEIMECFNEIIELADEYGAVVTEESRVVNAVHSVAKKGDAASRKASLSIRKSGRQVRRVKTTASKIPGHFDSLINGTFGALKRMDENERKRRILEGSFRFKLYRIIRNGALIGTGAAVAPALTAIGIITHLLRNRKLDERARDKLIQEMESELRIVKEKVKDADNKGDDRKKYQLMRIENRLEEDLKRIKFRLKGERNNTSVRKHLN